MARIIPVDTDVFIPWDMVVELMKPTLRERLPELRGMKTALHVTYDRHGVTINVKVIGPPKP